MTLHPQATEKAMNTAAFVTYGSSATSVVIYGLSLSEWGVLVSMACALGGFCVQVYMAWHATRR